MKQYEKYVVTNNTRRDTDNYIEDPVCGKLFKAMYIDKIIDSQPSEAMKEGIYFEYLCTGGLPRNGIKPEPERNAKGQLTTAYQRCEEAAKLFKKIIAYYKIKILKVGLVLSDDEKNGILDILAEWNGRECIIDLKYSGLLDNKWDSRGWHTGALGTKNDLMIQGVHYKILAQDILGIKDIPFYYFVFNSKDPTDMKIIEQQVHEDKMYAHRTEILRVANDIEKLMYQPNGFKAYPNYRLCKDCPLFDKCDERAEVPMIEVVHTGEEKNYF